MKRWIAALIGLGVGLRVYGLGAARLWYDESFTALLSHYDLWRIVQGTAGDTHPPLYYLIQHWFVYPGAPEWVIRLPSLVFSVVGLWLFVRVCQTLKMPQAVTVAALAFMAVSPMQIHYAQEARMYALLQAIILGLIVATLERRYLLAAVLGALALYTHNYGLFYVPVIWVIGFANEFRRPNHCSLPRPGESWQPEYMPGEENKFKACFMALWLPFVAWLPWAIALASQMLNVNNGYWIQPITPGSVIYALYMQAWGFAMPDTVQPLAVLLAMGLIMMGMIQPIKDKDSRVIAWLALAPLAGVLLVSVVWKPILLFRGLIGAAPMLYLLIAKAVHSQPRYAQIATGAMLLPVIMAGLAGHYVYNPVNKAPDMSALVGVRELWQPGDTVIHANDGSAVIWGVYGTDMQPQYEVPDCEQRNLGALTAQTRRALGISSLDQPITGRYFVIWGDGPTSPQCEVDTARMITAGCTELFVTRSNDYVFAGVYLCQSQLETLSDK